jgi:hypothetical protein
MYELCSGYFTDQVIIDSPMNVKSLLSIGNLLDFVEYFIMVV